MARRTTPVDLPPLDDDELAMSRRPSLVHWARLLLRTAWRRKAVALVVLVAVLAATVAYFVLSPPVYLVEAKVLAQRQQALPSVVRPVYDDLPTRSAWEMIHRRENLVAIVRQAILRGNPSDAAVSVPETGVDDGVAAMFRRRGAAPSEESAEDVLVRILDKHLGVAVLDGTITISLYWRDAQQAYDIVQAALHNFLEARHVQEVTSIDEVISVLEARAAALHEDLETATEQARKRAMQPPRITTPRVRQASQELVRLQSLHEAKLRAIQDVEEFRRRRLADLQAQLDQARNTLSDAHPTVIALRKDIGALAIESPQMQALREEEQKVRRQVADRAAQEGLQAPVGAAAAPIVEVGTRSEEDPRVREARVQYEQMLARVNAAKVELDAARAAFKYRYNVIWPPQVPSEPDGPNPKKVFVLGGFAALVLALGAAAAPDLLRGRIVERWQVEKELGLPVLGEIPQD